MIKRFGSHSEAAQFTHGPSLVRDPAEVTERIQKMMTENPRATTFVPFVSPDGHIDQSELQAALDFGFCIVRWHISESGSQGRS